MNRSKRTPFPGRTPSADGDPSAARAGDVLLIADDPRPRPGRHGGPAHQGWEPLDMESVVRKLIALLSEESPR